MGEKRKISLSSTHKQAGEESNNNQTSFDQSITQAEATIFTLGLEDLNPYSMIVLYSFKFRKKVHIYSHFVCQPQGCTAKTCPISQVT